MTLNKTGIEWCDYTWNPVTGCKHGCSYCYARKLSERFKRSFEPCLHHDRLNDPLKLKEPSTIFVSSMGDLFGKWVPSLWIVQVLLTIDRCKEHTFCLLTKNPERMDAFSCGHNNAYYGTTVTGFEDVDRIRILQDIKAPHTFVSFEPLLSDPGKINLDGIDGVIIGAQTNPTKMPPKGAVESIYDASVDAGCYLFYKDSMRPYGSMYRELAWEVHK